MAPKGGGEVSLPILLLFMLSKVSRIEVEHLNPWMKP